MEMVLQIKSENLNKARDRLLKDEIVNRASLTFKEASGFGVDGYACYISGTDEQLNRALEVIKVKDDKENVTGTLAEKLEDNKAREIIRKIKEEEDKASEGFGSFLG